MNMQIFKPLDISKLSIWIIFSMMLVASCKEKDYIYEVNNVNILPNNVDKDKEKTNEQYINIVYFFK